MLLFVIGTILKVRPHHRVIVDRCPFGREHPHGRRRGCLCAWTDLHVPQAPHPATRRTVIGGSMCVRSHQIFPRGPLKDHNTHQAGGHRSDRSFEGGRHLY